MNALMKTKILILAALLLSAPALSQETDSEVAPSPNAIVDAAKPAEWVQIPPEDLLIMTLAPNSDGEVREVVIQLMPAPFSQGWVSNIRTLARAKWYDGITVNRVQDNYVVQWGDAHGEDPEKAKPLPDGLNVMDEDDYTSTNGAGTAALVRKLTGVDVTSVSNEEVIGLLNEHSFGKIRANKDIAEAALGADSYSGRAFHLMGWQLAQDEGKLGSGNWPVHCYGMVGVGRNYSPDTGSGAELYTVIGHAPRHLDRNIALVGRIVSGMEHLSSMKRGSGELGFYTEDEAGLRTPIQSIRVVSDMDADTQPAYEYLSTESEAFAKYAEARANRRDPFFITPAGGADICNIPVPFRAVAAQ